MQTICIEIPYTVPQVTEWILIVFICNLLNKSYNPLSGFLLLEIRIFLSSSKNNQTLFLMYFCFLCRSSLPCLHSLWEYLSAPAGKKTCWSTQNSTKPPRMLWALIPRYQSSIMFFLCSKWASGGWLHTTVNTGKGRSVCSLGLGDSG